MMRLVEGVVLVMAAFLAVTAIVIHQSPADSVDMYSSPDNESDYDSDLSESDIE